MATTREIRRRIRSVKSIAQVTRAMEAVSASKMRRAQAQVQSTRPFADRAQAMLGFIARLRATEARESPLLQKRSSIKKVGLVLITADRGLAGGLNSNMIRAAVKAIREWQSQGIEVEIIAVGRKGRDWMRRFGPPIRAEFTGIGDRPASSFARGLARQHDQSHSVGPIARLVSDDFVDGRYDAVYVGFTRFWNTVRQEPVVRQILPIEPEEETIPMASDYIFEPDATTVLNAVLQGFIEVEILQALFEAIASEHSARMVAMRNATDAADELIGDLTLTYNKARQASITMSLLDISAAANAVQVD